MKTNGKKIKFPIKSGAAMFSANNLIILCRMHLYSIKPNCELC